MKLWLVAFSAAVIGSLTGGYFFRPTWPAGRPVLPVSAPARAEIPVRLTIPTIGVDAVIEPVGLDANNSMAVPTNIYNVGWYSLGVRPGEVGQAVMDGHLNTPDRTPSVFWDLAKLKPGNTIQVVDLQGKKLTFIVRKVESVSLTYFPLQEVFGPADSPKLNLITCDGYFDPKVGTFDQRLVVYADLG